ncbi:tetratricopeptide repeat protein [Polaromonas sp. C04]|uniref:tetratricopeptide repeat protein n=1 Tax=Polaromonas sp. C04 TaxID=1945857 RepID=UPI0009842776|nr:tetratricopeptide repeat protein [Polaromonas sp. C04]OOG54809.1 co-chaperone YbbN [Polaromonas sp. C04]
MIDITLENIQSDLIDASNAQPVLLDIWAEWCGPCKQLGPVLEKLEADYGGRFALAKLDADKVPQISQQLSQMFGVRSIPFCVLFNAGQPVDGFVGAIPEAEIRQFLDKHVASAEQAQAEEADAQAQDALQEGDTGSALEKLQYAVATDPANDDARFDYVKLLLQQGHVDDARVAFAPVLDKAATVRRFDSLQRWMDAIDFVASHADGVGAEAAFDAKIAVNKRDFEARFHKAQWLMAQQRWTDALDELLEILMRDKTWSEELARKTCIAILDIIEPPKPKVADGQIPPDDPTVASYRRRLSSVILS